MTKAAQRATPRRVRKDPAERREEVLIVARALFARDGYRATDVQHIADRAHVGKGTVYRLFPNKEALFLATVGQAMEELKDAAGEAALQQTDPLEKIRAGTRAYLAYFDANPEVIELFIQERAEFGVHAKPVYFAYRDKNSGDWYPLFDELRAQGRIRDMDSTLLGESLGDLLYGTVFANRLSGRRSRLAARADAMLDLFLHGILVPDAHDK